MSAKPTRKPASALACPCGCTSLAECCGRFISQGQTPQTALDLMRSRYSAYVLRDEAYLQSTWYGSTCPSGRLLSEGDGIKWLALEILRHEASGNDATVEFIARYKQQGRALRLHEISRFVREGGRWFYLDGHFPEDENR